MKSTQKIIIAAGLLAQFTAALHADNWSDAFLAFGGGTDPVQAAQNVLQAHDTKQFVSINNAINTAAKVGKTPEAIAVAKFLATGNTTSLKSSFSDADVRAVGQAIIDAASRAVPVTPQPTTPSQTETKQPSSSWGWWGNSTAQQSARTYSQADLDAAVDAAVTKVQQENIMVSAQNAQNLADIINSGKSGASLYATYVDYIFNLLQVAINSIADAGVQQKVIAQVQNKAASMKASVAGNKYQSRTIGRYSSAKKEKKHKSRIKKS